MTYRQKSIKADLTSEARMERTHNIGIMGDGKKPPRLMPSVGLIMRKVNAN